MTHTPGIHRVRRKQHPCECCEPLVTMHATAPGGETYKLQIGIRNAAHPTNGWAGRIGTVHASIVHLFVALSHTLLPSVVT
jgi:hypothetical protein